VVEDSGPLHQEGTVSLVKNGPRVVRRLLQERRYTNCVFVVAVKVGHLSVGLKQDSLFCNCWNKRKTFENLIALSKWGKNRLDWNCVTPKRAKILGIWLWYSKFETKKKH
jgi:hypothetical protein